MRRILPVFYLLTYTLGLSGAAGTDHSKGIGFGVMPGTQSAQAICAGTGRRIAAAPLRGNVIAPFQIPPKAAYSELVVTAYSPEGDEEWSIVLPDYIVRGKPHLFCTSAGNLWLAFSGLRLTPDPDLVYTPGPGIPLDVFALELTPAGDIARATRIGGVGPDRLDSAVLGPDGSLLLAGVTESPDFPLTAGAFPG